MSASNAGPADRRRAAAVAGHRGDTATARAAMGDGDAGVRATALSALARAGDLSEQDVLSALADPAPGVRQRALSLAARWPGGGSLGARVVAALADGDDRVSEVAAWALGEIRPSPSGAVPALAEMATGHGDALCREAAVAALGALGDYAGLPAILAATKDKPAIRRRAVLALAPFEGIEVDEALKSAMTDRDWQVRQAAEDLTRPEPGPGTRS